MAMKTTQNNKDVFLAKWIEGEISNSQLKTLVSEKDYKAFKTIQQGIIACVELEKPLDNTHKKIKTKIKTVKKAKSKTISFYSKLAIGIAASIILFFSLNTFFGNNEVNFQSNYAEQQVISLLDGSEVTLNAKSNLKYNKIDWKSKREVFLNGEAFFKVQKGKTFTVKTPNGSVTVLGTQFNVNSDKNFFDVICYEGKVKVVNNSKEYIITRNQTIRNSNGIITQKNLNLLNENPTWISGESNFRSVPLSQVISALQKQFNIEFDTTNINDTIMFSGSFNHKNLDMALASVFRTANIKYTQSNNKIRLSK